MMWRQLWDTLRVKLGRKEAENTSRQSSVPREILRFQPDRVLLERAAPPLGARWSLYILCGTVTFLILWAIFGRIDRIVAATGKIVTVDTPVVLQSYSVSLIKDVRVSMGQIVRKGEILVVLDATFAQADMSQLESRIASYSAQTSRLRCELDGTVFPPSAELSADVKVPAPPLSPMQKREIALQKGLFENRKAEFKYRIITYEEQLKRLATESDATVRDLGHRKERLKIFAEFEEMRRKLYQQGMESKAGFLEVQKDRHAIAGDVLRMESRIQELRHEMASTEADRAGYLTRWHNEVAQELITVGRELDSAHEQLSKARKLGELVDIRAPMDGVVLEVARRNVGSVANEAEPLVTIVPLDAVLEVEVEILPADIGYVRVGQLARVKLETMPFQKHGKIDATVLAVSEDAFLKRTATGEQSVYRARLKLPPRPLSSMRNLPPGFVIMPGMAATGEINVGDRRIIEYFLYPIIEGFDGSMREPR